MQIQTHCDYLTVAFADEQAVLELVLEMFCCR